MEFGLFLLVVLLLISLLITEKDNKKRYSNLRKKIKKINKKLDKLALFTVDRGIYEGTEKSKQIRRNKQSTTNT